MTPAQQADHIRAVLTKAGITQAALADAMGVSDRTVRRWVSGRQKVSASVMVAIKTIFRDGLQ
jgi:transcriptional regulator with XRE-family HTH domain